MSQAPAKIVRPAPARKVQASAPADLETATWLSRSLGNATVEYETASRSRSTPALLAPAGAHASTSAGTSSASAMDTSRAQCQPNAAPGCCCAT